MVIKVGVGRWMCTRVKRFENSVRNDASHLFSYRMLACHQACRLLLASAPLEGGLPSASFSQPAPVEEGGTGEGVQQLEHSSQQQRQKNDRYKRKQHRVKIGRMSKSKLKQEQRKQRRRRRQARDGLRSCGAGTSATAEALLASPNLLQPHSAFASHRVLLCSLLLLRSEDVRVSLAAHVERLTAICAILLL